jgi:hypothetical protein
MTEHDKRAGALPDHSVPWWMDGSTLAEKLKEPYFLANGVMNYWQKIRTWLLWPLAQLDPLTCVERLLPVLAWDRDITRFNNEPLALYRKRIKYAFINAKDSGETAGFIRIFARLGVGHVEIDERVPGRDWDIVTIRLNDTQLSDSSGLLAALIQHYGRTCRRYEFQVTNPVELQLVVSPLDWDHQCLAAMLEE